MDILVPCRSPLAMTFALTGVSCSRQPSSIHGLSTFKPSRRVSGRVLYMQKMPGAVMVISSLLDPVLRWFRRVRVSKAGTRALWVYLI